MKYAMCVMKRK